MGHLKIFALKTSAKKLSKTEKHWLGNQIVLEKCSSFEISTRYGLNQNTIQLYARMARNGTQFHDKGGRPPKFDAR